MKKQALQVCVLLVALAAVSLGLTALTRPFATVSDDSLTITAATYPMYTAALQVVGDAEGVAVRCLTAPTAGCLHDYQLSPAEMAVLTATDVLVLNGAGAEGFLQQALSALPSLARIDTAADIVPLCADEHHDHGHDHGDQNEHLWVSPVRYAQQVRALRDGLCALDPDRAAQYTANTDAYLARIEAIADRMAALALPADRAVLFHDSVAYAADELALSVLATLPIGEDAGVSVGDLTAAADAMQGQTVLLLFDSQYPADPLSLDGYAERTYTVVWDTAVLPRNGVADKDTWLWAMEHNLTQLEAMA